MVKRYTPIDQWGQVLSKCMEEDAAGTYILASDYDAIAALLTRDIRPLLDGMRGQMPEGLGKRAIATLVTRIDGLVP